MNNPLQRHLPFPPVQPHISNALRMVRDSTDNTPLAATVARELYTASVGRGVARIDPVPGRGVAAIRDVREVVGPGGGCDEGLGFQEQADLAGSVAVQEAGGYECSCAVAEHAPTPGWGENG
jgi:hypothetical protein